MGLILKNFETEQGIMTNKYVKIDSLHNMGEVDKIVLNCSEYYNVKARKENKEPMKANVVYFIPDCKLSGNSIIDAVYPLLKADLEKQGYEVLDDNNCYAEELANKE